jgi:hypothetical protein
MNNKNIIFLKTYINVYIKKGKTVKNVKKTDKKQNEVIL